MSILAIIGFIALLFLGKFIWDTFLTGNTDKDYEVNKRQNPEETARLENNVARGEYLNFNYKPARNPLHYQISLESLAEQWECSTKDAEKKYKESIIDAAKAIEEARGDVVAFLEEAVAIVRAGKHSQSIELAFDPEDVPAAFMHKWAKEVLDSYNDYYKGASLQSPGLNGNRAKSMALIAQHYKCADGDAQRAHDEFIELQMAVTEMKGENPTLFLRNLMDDMSQAMQRQAIEQKMNQKDTPAGIMLEWSQKIMDIKTSGPI